MTQKVFYQTKVLFLSLAVFSILSSCNDDSNSNLFKDQIKFLDEDEQIVSPNWGLYNHTAGPSSFGILVTDPTNVYLSITYPESEVRTAKFENEITHIKNPIDFFCTTPSPYIAILPEGAGINQYKAEYQKLIESKEFEPILNNNGRQTSIQSYYIEEYEQIKQQFFGRSDIGKLFIRTAFDNTSKLKHVDGRKFLCNIAEYYSVYTSAPEAFFKEDKYNHIENYKQDEAPIHVNQIIYGRIVWALLESEYSNEDLSYAMNKAEEYNFDPIKIERDSYASEILEHTAITVMSLGNSEELFCQSSTISELGKQLQSNYPKGTPFGQPIFTKWRYVHNDKIYNDIY